MGDADIRRLLGAIVDYLRPEATRERQILIEFLIFAIHQEIRWKDMFAFETFKTFRNHSGLKNAQKTFISLSRYLYEAGRIDQPMEIPNYQVPLPPIYEQYFLYLQQTKAVSYSLIRASRRVLAAFHTYLEGHNVSISALKIEDLDGFLAEFSKPFSLVSARVYRDRLRGFLTYLYREQKVLAKDLAPLLVGPPIFSQSNPPKFLRPHEIQQLFASFDLNRPAQIRTYAMVLLAYTLGLRPVEISNLTLDDISFQKGEITISNRKTHNPVILPIPPETLKSLAAYVLKVRPTTSHRALFLTTHQPQRPINKKLVLFHIAEAMKKAGLAASPYWLRHTYAQSLLQAGRSIYEIKEMMGHENIRSTQRYLHIHTELMRQVIFDETL